MSSSICVCWVQPCWGWVVGWCCGGVFSDSLWTSGASRCWRFGQNCMNLSMNCSSSNSVHWVALCSEAWGASPDSRAPELWRKRGDNFTLDHATITPSERMAVRSRGPTLEPQLVLEIPIGWRLWLVPYHTSWRNKIILIRKDNNNMFSHEDLFSLSTFRPPPLGSGEGFEAPMSRCLCVFLSISSSGDILVLG